jgi:tetratricopeptide (TPR) repeat protein
MPLNKLTMTLAGWRLLARFWLVLGRHAQAESAFSQLLAMSPQDGHALSSRAHLRAQTGRVDEAIADLRSLLAAQATPRAGDWFNLAYLLESQARLDEAEAAFREALALDPRLDRAWYGLSLTLIRLDRLDEAVAALKRNTELQPMSPYGWYQLARVHARLHQPEESLRIIRHLKGFEPKVAAQLQRETGLAV